MASLHQQQQGSDNALTTRWGGAGGSSNRIAAVDVEGELPSFHHVDDHHHQEHDHQDYQKPGWRKFLSFVGPSILVSVAYLDPGNIETDLQSGSNHRYELLWVLLVGLTFTLIIQSLAANLGVCTGKHLAELCKEEYPKSVTYCLWLLAEVAVVAADIPEVIGTAFGVHLLFHIPLWVGVLCTGFSTILLLGIQKYGMRKLELFMGVLVLLLAACFFGEMSYVKPPASDLFKGMFVPKFSGQGALSDTIALLGTNIVPHNLFLHSALVLSRKVPNTVRGINKVCRYFLIETGFAMFIAFVINVAMLAVPATVCSEENLTPENADRCNDLTLDSASFLLKNVLGGSSSKLYAIALLAAGQSSAIAATYAGQFIMQGFLGLKMRKWKRNLLTRSIAITPSLIASIIGGPSAAGRLIIIASMVLGFEIPFAVMPLLKFSGSSTKLGPHKNSIYIIVVSWILGLGIVGINVYFLSTGFVRWLIHNNLPKVGNVFIGLIVFPLMAIYILAVIYLIFRKDTVVSFIEPTKNDPTIVPANLENGLENSDEAMQMDHIPCREDLADIPLPQ